MGSRGPQPRECAMRQVAQRLGISERSAWEAWKSGIAKIKATPGAFEILLDSVRACADEHDLLRPASLECRPEYIQLFGERNSR
jgi:hypothetical protein